MLKNISVSTTLGTIRWSAPEVMRSRTHTVYSTKIDVFSFAVVLWELISFKLPYWWLNFEHEVQDLVESGKRLPIEAGACSNEFQQVNTNKNPLHLNSF